MDGNLTSCCIRYTKHPLCDLINKHIYYTGVVFVNFFLYFFLSILDIMSV
jgi:hypothetical protein